jgi:hypothetical protein
MTDSSIKTKVEELDVGEAVHNVVRMFSQTISSKVKCAVLQPYHDRVYYHIIISIGPLTHLLVAGAQITLR